MNASLLMATIIWGGGVNRHASGPISDFESIAGFLLDLRILI